MSQLVQLNSVLELSMAHVLVLLVVLSSSLVLHGAASLVVAIFLITSQPLIEARVASRRRSCSWYAWATELAHMITA